MCTQGRVYQGQLTNSMSKKEIIIEVVCGVLSFTALLALMFAFMIIMPD